MRMGTRGEAVAPAPSIPILATEQIDFGRLAVIVMLQSMSVVELKGRIPPC